MTIEIDRAYIDGFMEGYESAVVHYRGVDGNGCGAASWRASQHFAQVTCVDCMKSESYKVDLYRWREFTS